MKHLILFLTLITLSFSSCEKDPIDKCKDDPTCEYFRCKVDGKEWRPNCEGNGGLGCSAWEFGYYQNVNASDIIAINEETNQSIKLFVRNMELKIGNNKLHNDDLLTTQFIDGTLAPCNEFPIDTTLFNNFIVNRIDMNNRIVEGTFNFSCKNDCGKRVVITDGEFRIKYTF